MQVFGCKTAVAAYVVIGFSMFNKTLGHSITPEYYLNKEGQVKNAMRFLIGSEMQQKHLISFVKKHPWHNHVLVLCESDNGWVCDGMKQPGGCHSGITNFHQTKGILRYRCKDCDYDLCQLCYDANGKKANLAIGIAMSHPWHPHVLHEYDDKKSHRWICDGVYEPGGCHSNHDGFGWYDPPRFHCFPCNYDLCSKCFLSKGQPANNKIANIEKPPNHPWHCHALERCLRDNGWACDGMNQRGGCFSGTTGFHQTTGMQRFRCEKCDYDLCGKCFYSRNK